MGSCYLHEDSIFYLLDRVLSHASPSFANLVQTGGRIEDGLKTSKSKIIKHYLNSHQMRQDGQNTFPNRRSEKNEKEVQTISRPAPQQQQPYTQLALIYQLTTSPPPPPVYLSRNVYPSPPVYHPQSHT